jgi:anti-sigma factor RsiW
VTCREIADFLLAYVDGTLSPAARDAFDAHLAICPDCVHYLRQDLDTIAAAPAAFADDDVVDLPEDLVRAILAGRAASAS